MQAGEVSQVACKCDSHGGAGRFERIGARQRRTVLDRFGQRTPHKIPHSPHSGFCRTRMSAVFIVSASTAARRAPTLPPEATFLIRKNPPPPPSAGGFLGEAFLMPNGSAWDFFRPKAGRRRLKAKEDGDSWRFRGQSSYFMLGRGDCRRSQINRGEGGCPLAAARRSLYALPLRKKLPKRLWR